MTTKEQLRQEIEEALAYPPHRNDEKNLADVLMDIIERETAERDREIRRLTGILHEVDLSIQVGCEALDIEYPKDLHPADLISKYIIRVCYDNYNKLKIAEEAIEDGIQAMIAYSYDVGEQFDAKLEKARDSLSQIRQ